MQGYKITGSILKINYNREETPCFCHLTFNKKETDNCYVECPAFEIVKKLNDGNYLINLHCCKRNLVAEIDNNNV
jgi:hypothetical protein